MKVFVLDGPDYSGKTTQSSRLYEGLSQRYVGTLVKTPSRDLEGQKLLNRVYQDVCSKEEAFELFMENNVHVTKMLQSLKDMDFAVLDRFFLSTLAYHSAFLGKDLTSVVQSAVGNTILDPNLTYIFNTPLEERIRRARIRDPSRLTEDRLSLIYFQEHVLKKYLGAVKSFPNIMVVDGINPPDEITDKLIESAIKIIEHDD